MDNNYKNGNLQKQNLIATGELIADSTGKSVTKVMGNLEKLDKLDQKARNINAKSKCKLAKLCEQYQEGLPSRWLSITGTPLCMRRFVEDRILFSTRRAVS